ncbi:DUF5937 family protein [Peterkaempfera sp. SMS 1(5)a]|uniref:ArsR/SmtB family transcription factor n=1 Tax=Peterkaempfera podocarpi TaxID=3232308 RepID=UPI00366A8636
MPVVLLLEGVRREQVQVRLSPLAELCATLHALADPDHHPASGQWAASTRAEAPAELVAGCDEWAPLYGALRAQYFYPTVGGAAEDLDTEMARIAALGMGDFVDMTAAAILGRRRECTPAGPLREEWARRRFLEAARHASPHRHALAQRLADDPSGFRDRLVGFLRTFAEQVFQTLWARHRPALQAELHARRLDLHNRELGALSSLAPGISEFQQPHRLVFDKLYQAVIRLGDRPLLLLPSAHGAPHLVIKHQPGLPVSIQFPLVRQTAQPAFPQVQERLKALTDPNRLAVCRAVVREPATTVDIAANTGMTEPQVSRHLRRLRDTGLVHREREGRLVFYSLNTEALSRLGLDLLDTMRR